MYVLGINGGPRIGGNADRLIEKVLEGAESKGATTEKIRINDLKIAPCQECEKINNDGTCAVLDDFQEVFKKIMKADVVVLASPIFFGSLSAQTKSLIDRFQCYWYYKNILKKDSRRQKRRGFFIAVEASEREDFFDNAKAIVKNFFAVIDAKYSGEVLCKGVESKGDVLRKEECIKSAFSLGEKIKEKT